MTRRISALAVALGIGLVWGVWPVGPSEASGDSGCRSGDPLANVRDPGRLQVKQRCQTASGVVERTVRRNDGDIDVYIRPDPGAARLINNGNRHFMHGDLLGEIVPADQPGCRRGRPARFGTCTGAAVATPKVGRHVTLVGPHVLDRDHGWMEIHPVWRIR
jgi:hypothetical protein